MKKISLLLFAVVMTAFVFSGCKKTEDPAPTPTVDTNPKQEQSAVVIYFGGTWCPPCGAYGKPAKEALKSQLGSKVTLLSCQVNGGVPDPMNNPDANAFAQTFGVSSVPSLFIGGKNDLIKSVASNSSMSTNAVNEANLVIAKTAVAASNATVTLNGNDLKIETKTKFFEDQTEEYYLAAFVTESSLNYTQSSDGSINKNIHDNVLRAKASSLVTGDLISANNKSGDVKAKTFNLTLNGAWNKDNMSVVLVLWRKNTDGKYTICNGFTTKLK